MLDGAKKLFIGLVGLNGIGGVTESAHGICLSDTDLFTLESRL